MGDKKVEDIMFSELRIIVVLLREHAAYFVEPQKIGQQKAKLITFISKLNNGIANLDDAKNEASPELTGILQTIISGLREFKQLCEQELFANFEEVQGPF